MRPHHLVNQGHQAFHRPFWARWGLNLVGSQARPVMPGLGHILASQNILSLMDAPDIHLDLSLGSCPCLLYGHGFLPAPTSAQN